MTNCYECVGVGCGPSNLSLASLLYGHRDIRSIFFEQRPEFSWHEGMMLPDAGLQVSLFKDLVTLAEPTNQFSFVSYLHRHGRLYQFLNARFAQITRQEFGEYLKWAAHANENVCFGERVLSVDFDGQDFVVQTSKREVHAHNVAVGVGIALSGAGRRVPLRRRWRAGLHRGGCTDRRRARYAAAHRHRPADEDAHAPGRAGRGHGPDLLGRARYRR